MSTGALFQVRRTTHSDHGAVERGIIVALPAYNEEHAIGLLLPRIYRTLSTQSLPFHILVVDDGSSDSTADVVETFGECDGVKLIRHAENQGLGGALRTAFRAALAHDGPDDIIVTLDADNTHPPELMLRMLRMIEEGHDVVIASRFRNGARAVGVPPHRQLLSLGANLLMRVLFPIKGARDYTCGYRAYRAELLRQAHREFGEDFVSEEGFSCMADVLFKLRRLSPIVGEVPLILRYDHKPGISKMNVSRTVSQTFRLLFTRKFSRRW